MRTYPASIVGVKHEDRVEYIAEHVEEGDEIELRRDKANPHDQNAVGCWHDDRLIGYIPQRQGWVAKALDERDRMMAIVTDFNTDDDDNLTSISIDVSILADGPGNAAPAARAPDRPRSIEPALAEWPPPKAEPQLTAWGSPKPRPEPEPEKPKMKPVLLPIAVVAIILGGPIFAMPRNTPTPASSPSDLALVNFSNAWHDRCFKGNDHPPECAAVYAANDTLRARGWCFGNLKGDNDHVGSWYKPGTRCYTVIPDW